MIIDEQHYVPLKECSLDPFNEQDVRSYDGVLQHITFQNGQAVGHIFLEGLDHKVSLPLQEHVSSEEVTLYIKESSIRTFGAHPYEVEKPHTGPLVCHRISCYCLVYTAAI